MILPFIFFEEMLIYFVCSTNIQDLPDRYAFHRAAQG
jgi:hypothetical protein